MKLNFKKNILEKKEKEEDIQVNNIV